MNRENYWRDEYDRASKEYEESREKFLDVNSDRAVALATMNRAERELNRLSNLRFGLDGEIKA